MSHEITATDGLVLAEKEAWHGLGTVVENAPTPYEAMHIAGLDWEVGKLPLFAELPDGTSVPMENKFCTYRKDNGELFNNLVTDHYVVKQNKSMFDDIYEIAKVDEGIEIETAGSLRGGQVVFALVRLNTMGLQNGDDLIKQYALLKMGHTGNESYLIGGTNWRVGCANTVRAAMFADSYIKVRHMGERIESDQTIMEIQAHLGDIREQGKLFEQQMEQAITTEWNEERVAEYFVKVWSKMNGGINSNPESVNHRRMITTIDGWKDCAYNHVNQDNCRGTAYAAYQAVTQYASHDLVVRDTGFGIEDARNTSVVEGRGREVSEAAHSLLVDAIA